MLEMPKEPTWNVSLYVADILKTQKVGEFEINKYCSMEELYLKSLTDLDISSGEDHKFEVSFQDKKIVEVKLTLMPIINKI